MKFLVLGCNGMAGHTISLYLHERGHDVLGFDRQESKYQFEIYQSHKDRTLPGLYPPALLLQEGCVPT